MLSLLLQAGDTPLSLLLKHHGTSLPSPSANASHSSAAQLHTQRSSLSSVPLRRHPTTVVSFERIRALLQQHMELQRRLKALRSIEASKAILEALEAELAQLVGLEGLKQQLRRWGKGLLLDQRRQALGLAIAPRKAPHMAFLGSPGTGEEAASGSVCVGARIELQKKLHGSAS